MENYHIPDSAIAASSWVGYLGIILFLRLLKMYFSLNFTEKYKVCNDQNLFEDVASLMKVLWASFCIVQNYSEIKGDQKKVYAP